MTTVTSTPLQAGSNTLHGPAPAAHQWRRGASLDAVRAHATLSRGDAGPSVRQLQELLKAAGFPVRVDGVLGRRTQAAIREFQTANGCQVDGVVGHRTLGALEQRRHTGMEDSAATRARHAAAAQVGSQQTRHARTAVPLPVGTHRAGDLARQHRSEPAPQAAAAAVVGGPPPANAADARLAGIQSKAMDSARLELAAGVHERGRTNRGLRVDEYARNAHMAPGGAWCGYFATWNYTQAAKESGMRFTGTNGMHSMQKARSFFNYHSFTSNKASTREGNAQLKQTHGEQGSQRRFMTLSGTPGDKWATARHLAHETYEHPSQLPIRPGDTVLFHTPGHVAQVEAYDAATGKLTVLEGNWGGKVNRRTVDLNNAHQRKALEGFGRPALGDFTPVQ